MRELSLSELNGRQVIEEEHSTVLADSIKTALLCNVVIQGFQAFWSMLFDRAILEQRTASVNNYIIPHTLLFQSHSITSLMIWVNSLYLPYVNTYKCTHYWP